ncbi:MAG: 16S rRNA processing protein RimM [Magnetococcales bacterium]|nr:16S rRNA processing protein RimM [Magnetococcales bacterium]
MIAEVTRWVAVGRLKGAFGVRGEVRITPLPIPVACILPDPNPQRFLTDDWLMAQGAWWLGKESPAEPAVQAMDTRRHGDEILTRLKGIENREALQAMAGTRIWIPENALPELPGNHHYWFRLTGMQVLAETAEDPGTFEPLGVLDTLLATGSNDVLVVLDATGEERLLPFIRDTILKVDEQNHLLHVRLMPGL